MEATKYLIGLAFTGYMAVITTICLIFNISGAYHMVLIMGLILSVFVMVYEGIRLLIQRRG